MRSQIIFPSITLLIAVLLVTSGCGLTVNVAFAPPSITPIVATSIPAGFILPTLTPLPLLPSATLVPPTAALLPSPTTALVPSSTTPLGQAATATRPIPPTQTPVSPTQTVPPPPPQPTQVDLPQLKTFDPSGTVDIIEVQVKGVSVPKSLISFQVIACSPNCKNKPDGTGITSIDFEFYKVKTQLRSALDNYKPVFKTTEKNKPYCAFGGDSPCPNWIFAEHSNKWPNGATIENGDYTLWARVNGNTAHWEGLSNFTIQR